MLSDLQSRADSAWTSSAKELEQAARAEEARRGDWKALTVCLAVFPIRNRHSRFFGIDQVDLSEARTCTLYRTTSRTRPSHLAGCNRKAAEPQLRIRPLITDTASIVGSCSALRVEGSSSFLLSSRTFAHASLRRQNKARVEVMDLKALPYRRRSRGASQAQSRFFSSSCRESDAFSPCDYSSSRHARLNSRPRLPAEI